MRLTRTALLAITLLAFGSNLLAQSARSPAARNDGDAAMALAEKQRQRQLFCDGEQSITEPWIRWASENRAACLVQSHTVAERDACLESALAHLDSLEKEHATTYAMQSEHLKPDRPVMRILMARLAENTRTAALAIRGDAEPTELRSMRLQNCLNGR